MASVGVRGLASPHSFLGAMAGTFALFLAPGIWQPLVRCLTCLGIYRNIGFLRDDFSPLFLVVTLLCLVLPLEDRIMDFPGDDSRNRFRIQHSLV